MVGFHCPLVFLIYHNHSIYEEEVQDDFDENIKQEDIRTNTLSAHCALSCYTEAFLCRD